MSRHTHRFVACNVFCLVLVVLASAASGYHILKKIPIVTGEGTWDFGTIDGPGRRLFLAHETQVEVLNVDSGNLISTIPDMKGAHGIALAAEFNHGFISNGTNATVTMFDMNALKRLADIPAGNLPDTIVYDPSTKQVFSFNTVSRNATVIRASDGSVAGTIALDGKPEFAVPDGQGYVFDNLVDKAVLARIDARTLAIDRRWPVTNCDRPTSLAMDEKTHRLFIGCRNLTLYVMDSDLGKIIANLPIGDNVDTTAFDPATGLIFSSTEDGVVTILREDGPDSFSVVETVKTHKGSQTMALDLKTHRLFVPYGDVDKVPPQAPGGKVTKKVATNSFGILVLGQ
jgi:DNA-binding beta-propeller fold protein YncE